MPARTFAIGDIHGDLVALQTLMGRLPNLCEDDTIVFLGDYVDRGPWSAQVIAYIREMQDKASYDVVCLRGNHEDAWLRVIDRGWDEFVYPPSNGCLAAMRSFTGGPTPAEDEMPQAEELEALFRGTFFPKDVVAWMNDLKWWHEDDHAIYVHAGLVDKDGEWVHPKDADPQIAILWTRSDDFFTNYRGKRVVVGHTATETLPVELSYHTPADPKDLWAGECVVAIDTSAGKGGFLTALELPALLVYESR